MTEPWVWSSGDRHYGFGATGWTPIVGKWSPTNSQGITSISPTSTYGNDVALTIIGTNFQQGFSAKMTKSMGTNVVIEARDVRWDSSTMVTVWFTIPNPRELGTYNVVVTNPDGTTRSLPDGFEVK